MPGARDRKKIGDGDDCGPGQAGSECRPLNSETLDR